MAFHTQKVSAICLKVFFINLSLVCFIFSCFPELSWWHSSDLEQLLLWRELSRNWKSGCWTTNGLLLNRADFVVWEMFIQRAHFNFMIRASVWKLHSWKFDFCLPFSFIASIHCHQVDHWTIISTYQIFLLGFTFQTILVRIKVAVSFRKISLKKIWKNLTNPYIEFLRTNKCCCSLQKKANLCFNFLLH